MGENIEKITFSFSCATSTSVLGVMECVCVWVGGSACMIAPVIVVTIKTGFTVSRVAMFACCISLEVKKQHWAFKIYRIIKIKAVFFLLNTS